MRSCRVPIALPIALMVAGVGNACTSHATQANEVLIPACDTIPLARHGPSPRVPEAQPRAGRGALAGSVDERQTAIALVGAVIRVRGIDSVATHTDSTGGFVVEGLPPGRYAVLIARIGYDGYRDSVELVADAVVTRRYHLKFDACP